MNNDFKYSRIFSLFIAVTFLLLFNGMEFLHHHSEIQHNDNCKVCSLTKSLSSVVVPLHNILLINNEFEIVKSESKSFIILLQSLNSNSDRAPPLFS